MRLAGHLRECFRKISLRLATDVSVGCKAGRGHTPARSHTRLDEGYCRPAQSHSHGNDLPSEIVARIPIDMATDIILDSALSDTLHFRAKAEADFGQVMRGALASEMGIDGAIGSMPLYTHLDRIRRGLNAQGIGSRDSVCPEQLFPWISGTTMARMRFVKPPRNLHWGRRVGCSTLAPRGRSSPLSRTHDRMSCNGSRT